MHGRLALLLIASACSRRSGDARPVEPPRLYTAVELASYEAGLLTRLAEAAKQKCDRPIVREPGVDGPATAELVELVEPTGPLATCAPAFAKMLNAGNARATDLVEARDPAVVALAGTCGPLLEQTVRVAAAHRDACSPYQLGIRKEPESWMNVLYGGHVLGLHARLVAERGTPVAAMWSLIDAAAAVRDLARGHVGLIASMISIAATDALVEHARVILETAKLAPADLDALIAGVDALLASEPPFADSLVGERAYFELYLAMPKLKGNDWKPPGGWSFGPPAATDESLGEPVTKNPLDEAGVMFETATVMAVARDKACPRTATLAACHKGLIALGETATQKAESTKADPKRAAEVLWGDLLKSVGTADVAASARRIRVEIVSILAGIAEPTLAQYTAKRADGYARIGALRFHLEVVRKGHCPTEAELAAPPYPALRLPVALGDVLDVQRRASGDLDISAPAWTASKKPAWRISCKPR